MKASRIPETFDQTNKFSSRRVDLGLRYSPVDYFFFVDFAVNVSGNYDQYTLTQLLNKGCPICCFLKHYISISLTPTF